MRGFDRTCVRTTVRKGKKNRNLQYISEYCAHFSEKEVKTHRTALRERNNHDKNRTERDSREPGSGSFLIRPERRKV